MRNSFEVIIPVYNESHRITQTYQEIIANLENFFKHPGEVVRIWWADDGSTDGSIDTVKTLAAQNKNKQIENRFLQRKINQGKGSIMRFAIDQIKKFVSKQAIVCFWDSDGELDSYGLGLMMRTIANDSADLVFGTRFLYNQNNRNTPLQILLGNKILTYYANQFSKLNLSDVHCCARSLRAGLLFEINLTTDGFDFEAEFVGKVAKLQREGRKLTITEQSLIYRPRSSAEGKKISIKHLMPQLYQAIRCRYLK